MSVRQRGLFQHVGLTLVYFIREQIVPHPDDVLEFALELAVPLAAREHSVERIARVQQFCPVDVIRDVLDRRR